MTQEEKRKFLINRLLKEQPRYAYMKMPDETGEQKKLLRSLFNIRMPESIGEDFINIQDEYLWKGDITTLKVDAIVNAANSQMLGCFCPCHGCIDNAIHTYAGVQLRNECNALMEEKRKIYGRSYEEPTGRAMVTKGYNLPCSYVIHTVGPIISGRLKKNDCQQLSDCYRSCLEAALENGIKSIAFCCISTGEFHFPNDKIDYEIYRTSLGCNGYITQN